MNVSQPISVLQRYSGGLVPLVDQTYSAGSFVLTWASKQFKKLIVEMDWNAGGVASIVLNNLSNTSFDSRFMYTAGAAPAAGSGGVSASGWNIATGSGATSAGQIGFEVDLLSAPSKKGLRFTNCDDFAGASTPIIRIGAGKSQDTTNDPTQMTITLDASRTGSIKIWGLT